jgi:hypothetical protein
MRKDVVYRMVTLQTSGIHDRDDDTWLYSMLSGHLDVLPNVAVRNPYVSLFVYIVAG